MLIYKTIELCKLAQKVTSSLHTICANIYWDQQISISPPLAHRSPFDPRPKVPSAPTPSLVRSENLGSQKIPSFLAYL